MSSGHVWAITTVHNEADVIADSVLHLLEEDVDGVIVADNASTDGTRDLLADIRAEYDQLVVLDEKAKKGVDPLQMTRLAAAAGDGDAEWIIPFEADEIWFDHLDRLTTTLRHMNRQFRVIRVPSFLHLPTLLDTDEASPFAAMTYRQALPEPEPKVCFRYREGVVVEENNRSVTFASDKQPLPWEEIQLSAEVRHFPCRSYEQFRRKAEAEPSGESVVGALWREYGAVLERGGDEALRRVYDTWFYVHAPLTAGLVCDPAPFRRWSR